MRNLWWFSYSFLTAQGGCLCCHTKETNSVSLFAKCFFYSEKTVRFSCHSVKTLVASLWFGPCTQPATEKTGEMNQDGGRDRQTDHCESEVKPITENIQVESESETDSFYFQTAGLRCIVLLGNYIIDFLAELNEIF